MVVVHCESITILSLCEGSTGLLQLPRCQPERGHGDASESFEADGETCAPDITGCGAHASHILVALVILGANATANAPVALT